MLGEPDVRLTSPRSRMPNCLATSVMGSDQTRLYRDCRVRVSGLVDMAARKLLKSLGYH